MVGRDRSAATRKARYDRLIAEAPDAMAALAHATAYLRTAWVRAPEGEIQAVVARVVALAEGAKP